MIGRSNTEVNFIVDIMHSLDTATIQLNSHLTASNKYQEIASATDAVAAATTSVADDDAIVVADVSKTRYHSCPETLIINIF